ncbi:MAG TPA: sigma-70 family RNA polymerase sigma factor [Solirubrobacteraceae bacterium]|jgi:RNA polymerase sigma-70 factor (ECF subfamily)
MAPEPDDDAALVARLRRGDEAAFMEIVDAWGPAMLRVARMYVPSQAVAEEVVQETWIAVLNGIDRFEARSSLRGWVFSILLNRARTVGKRERRTLPFASLGERLSERRGEPAVDPDRFQGRRDERPGWWAAPPAEWSDPQARLESAEGVRVIGDAIKALPQRQRDAVVLRDVLGLTAEEAGSALGVSEGNQRVLLHRGRAKVRAELESHYAAAEAAA